MIPTSAASAAESGYRVTLVARTCPSYSDIYAGEAHDGSAERLEDLWPGNGHDTPSALVTPAHGADRTGAQMQAT